jgi:3D (Asp-Asp-Asp) domain-containing protein
VGCVAISDRHIHLGSKCVIDGLGVFTITDHMNKRYNNGPIRIDVYVGRNVKVARKFGCQHHNITIYE